jgi:hypothetical protein
VTVRLREHAGLSPCAPLARPPYPVHLSMPARLRKDFVLTPAANTVMGDYLLRCFGSGSAPRFDICSEARVRRLSARSQLPAPKPDHPRRSVSGFVIRTQPCG